MFTINTSVLARLNNADLRSKSWSSPRSRPSVPSTSITSVELYFDGHIQIPLVVCCRCDSSITSKLVPNSRLSKVDLPVDWEPKTATTSYAKPLSSRFHFARYWDSWLLQRQQAGSFVLAAIPGRNVRRCPSQNITLTRTPASHSQSANDPL